MKRIFLLILSVALLIGCSTGGSDDSYSSVVKTQEEIKKEWYEQEKAKFLEEKVKQDEGDYRTVYLKNCIEDEVYINFREFEDDAFWVPPEVKYANNSDVQEAYSQLKYITLKYKEEIKLKMSKTKQICYVYSLKSVKDKNQITRITPYNYGILNRKNGTSKIEDIRFHSSKKYIASITKDALVKDENYIFITDYDKLNPDYSFGE